MSNINIAEKQEVRIYSVEMGERIITSSARDWKELQRELANAKDDRGNLSPITYAGMKAVIGETKVTLEADEAMVPTTGYTLFLMPIKTKSGVIDYDVMGYTDIRNAIKEIIAKDSSAKSHFNKERNYTIKGTSELRDLLKSFKPGKSVKPAKAVTKTTETKKAVVSTAKPVVKSKPVIFEKESFVNIPYKGLRDRIRDIIQNDPKSASYFNADNKNYTIKGTETLRSLLTSYTDITSNLPYS